MFRGIDEEEQDDYGMSPLCILKRSNQGWDSSLTSTHIDHTHLMRTLSTLGLPTNLIHVSNELNDLLPTPLSTKTIPEKDEIFSHHTTEQTFLPYRFK